MQIVITEQSIESFNTALRFRENELQYSVQAINDLIEEVFDTINRLESNPYQGQIEPFIRHSLFEYRRLICQKFKIIYRVEHEIIYVVDVFDSRQSPSKMKLD